MIERKKERQKKERKKKERKKVKEMMAVSLDYTVRPCNYAYSISYIANAQIVKARILFTNSNEKHQLAASCPFCPIE